MSVFPSLPGLAYGITRTPEWSTLIQEAVSGSDTAIALWSYPRWHWDLPFDILRSGTEAELQALAGFFNSMKGQFGTFLYEDADDNAVTAQAIDIGDGSTKTFQLVRTFGGNVEPIFAPHVVSQVYLNGTPATGWTVSNWGSSTPGVLTFASAPGSGVAITADFSFYFPCRMESDTQDFKLFLSGMYSVDSIKFKSRKIGDALK